MSDSKSFISPVSIDLGAKNTGVYFAHYPEGSSLNKIKKTGKVYQLDQNSYTLLMAGRTAARHQRRGYDRRQLIKKLFKLIWEEHFKLHWNKDVQQTISFLFNRRGFTFLTEEYDPETLRHFPKDAYNLLPEELKEGVSKNEDRDGYDFDSALAEWAQDKSKIKECFESIQKKSKEIKKRLFVISGINKLQECCNQRITGKEIKEDKKRNPDKLSEFSKWAFKKWIEKYKIKDLPDENSKYFKNNKVNMIDYLNEQDKATATKILESLPKATNEETKKLKRSHWNFKIEAFNLEKSFEKLTPPDESEQHNNKSENPEYLKTHLHHLAFALYKINNELKSGSRYRSKYFEEIKKELICRSHTHGYLKRFCQDLHSGKFKFKNFIEKATLNQWKENGCKKLSDIESTALSYLIGNLSNWELKPLRKYFNDKNHRGGAYWDEARLAAKFENWILKEWRINPKKDRKKARGKQGDYEKLKEEWEDQHKGKLIGFFLNKDPFLTIPPYQDNNNRRPPKCQSLVLNVNYLNEDYPEWREWLDSLKKIKSVKDYLRGYEDQLQSLKSSGHVKTGLNNNTRPNGDEKNNFSYFGVSKYQRGEEYLKARVLQFLFDRVKAADSLHLNEIYSYTKKFRQSQSNQEKKQEAKIKLEQAINKSKLPEALKTSRNYNNNSVFPEKRFLHLICKYYKFRQKAKDGRIFIHPKYRYLRDRGYENTGHFDDKSHLLSYCHHKPRQKRYQIWEDMAALLQVSPNELKDEVTKIHNQESQNGNSKTRDEQILNWLKQIHGLKTHCAQAAKEQKARRGRLKSDIQRVFGFIHYKQPTNNPSHQQPKNNEIKKILQHYKKVEEPFKLYQVCEKAKALCLKITNNLYNQSRQKRWQDDLSHNPAAAVYLLAQINNIAFKERNGNAKTCPICSMDNAQRMYISDNKVKAQRLTAISTRLIDGAVLRMARIVGDAIAKDKWATIKPELDKGNKVCVPIITESNQFEFEPSREELVKSQRKLPRTGSPLKRGGELKIFQNKIDRIQNANAICPYDGINISGEGEIDHIIPRSSKWGILNDEANLIWASKEGNQHKTNRVLSLANLHIEYKKSVFPGKNDEAIKQWIFEKIGDGSDENFKFGKYLSFINLKPDEQKAFRHALFLTDHPLKEKIIQVIDNRTRALVNGTQRYFAEVLANKLHKLEKTRLYKLTKREKAENLLSFDYFGVSSDGNSANSVPFIRRNKLENKKDNKNREHIYPELQKYKKTEKGQLPFSHLIDAQIAFMIALSNHYKEGRFKIKAGHIDPYNYIDNTNKWGDLYKITAIPESECDDYKIELNRRKPEPKDKNATHRPLFNQNAVAMRFLKLIQIDFKKQGQTVYLSGFLSMRKLKQCLKDSNSNNYVYAKEIKNKELQEIKNLYFHKFTVIKKQHTGITMIENFGNKKIFVKIYSLNKQSVYNFLIDNFNSAGINGSSLSTENLLILKNLQKLWYFTKKESVLKTDKQGNNKFNKQNDNKFKCAGLTNPQLKYAWEDLEKNIDKTKDLYSQIKNYFLKQTNSSFNHTKSRKTFSLPVKTKKGFLIKKKNWNGGSVFYVRPASNDFSQTVLHKNKDERLSNIYRKNNIFYIANNATQLKSHLKPICSESAIDSNKHYEAVIPNKFSEYIIKIENRRTDRGRPQFKFYFLENKKMNFEKFKEFICDYPFRKLQNLKAKYRREYIDKNLIDHEELNKLINEIENEIKNKKTERKALLSVLKEFQKLWETSQTEKILEYQAKAKFTLKISKNIKNKVEHETSRNK